jgi:glycosyltransferase involved in cell wall biosynthesis
MDKILKLKRRLSPASGKLEGPIEGPQPLSDPSEAGFCREFYLAAYPDIATSGMDPYGHYIKHGRAEGRLGRMAALDDGSEVEFYPDFYLAAYPDVAASGINPYEHYVRHGRAEGRFGGVPGLDALDRFRSNPLFDRDWYLRRYPDVEAGATDPYVHYYLHGAAEGRDPSPLFNTNWYLEQNPDVKASGVNPLLHYYLHGAAEGRDPHPLFGDADLRNALASLETTAASHVEANEFDVALRLIHVQAFGLWIRTQSRGWISGSDRLDGLCLTIGREVRGVAERLRPVAQAGRRRYVYAVSRLYRDGGHTRLLEDLIAAQPHADHYIIWTWGESADTNANMAEVLRVKDAVPLQVLRGEPVEKLRAAFAFLTELCPEVLVHLGHPNDPITVALMQPGIARRRLMIHHGDSCFALGRSLGGTRHVALGRHFQDFARQKWALETVLLPLTCEEPVVAKGTGWVRDRPFLTVTSGSSAKFHLNGELSYLDVLTERFAARDGAHVHIGTLSAEQMLRVEQHLDKLSCRERFVYREYVPHLASALSELAPWVYIDSYPTGGGRAIVEAMAAGLPICAASHDPNLDSSSICYPERFWWTHPAQIRAILAELDPTTVERHAALSRNYFERHHSLRTFKQHLQVLLS